LWHEIHSFILFVSCHISINISDGCSLLINFRRRVVLGQYNFKERVNCIRFSPDGKYCILHHCCSIFFHYFLFLSFFRYFVVGLFKKTQIWKTPSLKKEFAPFKLFKTYVGHSDKVVSVEWSADSQYIITAARDGTAKIFSLEQNAEFTPPTFTGHMDHIVSAFFAGKDNKVVCWLHYLPLFWL
jgi:WD domain, G-beta repeat.